MFKSKTSDESSVLKFSSLICLIIFVVLGGQLGEELAIFSVGFGVFSSSLLLWMSGRI